MKVVLFCGGGSLRLAEQAEAVPKPMITVGYRQEIFDWLAAGNGRRVGADRRLPG